MKKVLLFLMLFVGFSLTAQENKKKNIRYDIAVNGNCEMCKKRIEKAALSLSGVKFAQWHIEDKVLHVVINEAKVSIDQVKEVIAQAGHDTENVKASDVAYQKLHHCCKYPRTE